MSEPEMHGVYAAVDAYRYDDPVTKKNLLEKIRGQWDGAYNVQGQVGPGQFVVQIFYDGSRYGDKPLEDNAEQKLVRWLSGVIHHPFHVLPLDDLHIEESTGHLDMRVSANPENYGNLHRMVLVEGLPHTHWTEVSASTPALAEP